MSNQTLRDAVVDEVARLEKQLESLREILTWPTREGTKVAAPEPPTPTRRRRTVRRRPKASRKTWAKYGHLDVMIAKTVAGLPPDEEVTIAKVWKALPVVIAESTIGLNLGQLCKAEKLVRVDRGVYRHPVTETEAPNVEF